MTPVYILTTEEDANAIERLRKTYQRMYPRRRVVMMRDKAAWIAARQNQEEEKSA